MADTGPIRVLHVDDERAFASVVAEYLEAENDRLEVETATSVEEGLEAIAGGDVDCVVSDYDMPEATGIEFLERVREREPGFPFVLFTGKGSEAVASDAISAGATDYIQKGGGPETYAVLANRIVQAVERRRAREAAEAANERVATVYERMTDAIVAMDDEYRYTYVNAEAEALLETDAGDLVGRRAWDVFPLLTETEFGAALRRAMEDQETQTVEDYWEPLDRWLLVRVYPSEDGISVYFRDVSERVERERQLREDKAFNELALDTVVDFYWVIDLDGVVLDWSDEDGSATGYTAEEAVGMHSPEFFPEYEHDYIAEKVREIRETGEATAEADFLTGDGEIVPFRFDGMALTDDDGTVDRLCGLGQDVSERREHEQTLAALHDATRELVQEDTVYGVAERAVETAREVLDMPLTACWLYDEASGTLDPVAVTEETSAVVGDLPTYREGEGLSWEAFESGEIRVYDDLGDEPGRLNPDTVVESELILPLGEYGVVNVGATERAAFDELDVSLARMFGANVEAALDRAHRETRLREEQAFFDQALSAIEDLFYVVDTDGGMRRWNDRVETVTGYDADRIGEMTAMDFVAEDDRDRVAAAFDRVMTDGSETVEVRIRTADGELVPYELTATTLTDPDGTPVGVVGIGRDVTERKARERQVQDQKAKIELLHEVATEIEACERPDEVYETIVQAAEAVLEFDIAIADSAEGGVLVPRAVSTTLDEAGYYDETPIDADDNLAARAYRTGESSLVADLHEADVAPADTRYRSALTVPIGDHGVFQSVAEDPGAFDEDDLELVELLCSHARERLSSIAQTEQLRTRTERLEQQNDRLDEFASMVSHDLRNPMEVARAGVELARLDGELSHLDQVETSLDRMDAIVDDLLTIARADETTTDAETVSLAATVRRCWSNLETDGATLATEGDRPVRADPGHFRQLVENLLSNAVDHGGDGVTVRVGTVDGGFYVADDGPGIPPEERDRVFEANYSTAETGMGFGLRIVDRVAEAHGWHVEVTESEDGGARFEVTGVDGI